MLNQIKLPQSSDLVHFVWAKDLVAEDLIGKYMLPYHDLLINIVLENVQLRDSFENTVYEQLLPFQKFCIDSYKQISSMKTNVHRIEEKTCGFGFVLFDPKTNERFFTVHRWMKPGGVSKQFFLEFVWLDRPIPGNETNVLIPSNITLNDLSNDMASALIRNFYITEWDELKLNPYEFGMFMDKTFYGKTPFHIRNYFENGGKSLKQMIDTDLSR